MSLDFGAAFRIKKWCNWRTLALIIVLLMVLFLARHHAAVVRNRNRENDLREAVYNGKMISYTTIEPVVDSRLYIPELVVDFYRTDPEQVLLVLLEIMERGTPFHSALAAGYAFSLLYTPSVGICIVNFEDSTYDSFDKNWKTTPRMHWIGHVRKTMMERRQRE